MPSHDLRLARSSWTFAWAFALVPLLGCGEGHEAESIGTRWVENLRSIEASVCDCGASECTLFEEGELDCQQAALDQHTGIVDPLVECLMQRFNDAVACVEAQPSCTAGNLDEDAFGNCLQAAISQEPTCEDLHDADGAIEEGIEDASKACEQANGSGGVDEGSSGGSAIAVPTCVPGSMSTPLIDTNQDPCLQNVPSCPAPDLAAIATCDASGTWSPTCECVVRPICGNGLIEFPELCDGSNFQGESCASFGQGGGGFLICDTTCVLDFSMCVDTQ